MAHALAEIVAFSPEDGPLAFVQDAAHEDFVQGHFYAFLIEDLDPFVLVLALVGLLCRIRGLQEREGLQEVNSRASEVL